MSEQLHKRFNDEQLKIILQWYLDKSLSLAEALERLQCKERRFYQLLKKYKENKKKFTIAYPKKKAHNKLTKKSEKIIKKELEKEKALINDKNIPLKYYNFSAVRDEAVKRIKGSISAQTVRNRAKLWGYVNPLKQKKSHDKEVETTACGMLLQHDSSRHLWSPFASSKWTLITTLDDYSRKLLYGDFTEVESAWSHILAVESLVLTYGVGLAYYVDNHSIFRFVCYRDSLWYNLTKGTDDATTEWKRVVEQCGMKIWYASSPQAKGKIERPYRWLQDRIVRRCAKEGIKNIKEARIILQEEIKRYNEYQVHSTTKEIPEIRWQKATKEGKTLFKPFKINPPYQSSKDIFCLKDQRKVSNYRKISWHKYQIKIPKIVPINSNVTVNAIPHKKYPELRIWHQDKLIKIVRLKGN
jgi:hypothetical protein